MIEAGPNPAVDGLLRCVSIDLAQWVYTEFRIPSADRRSAGCCARWAIASSLRVRAITPRTPPPLRRLKKLRRESAEIAQHEAAGQPIEVWFADEVRIGQKNKITRPLRQAQEGWTRHPAVGATRSAHRLSLYIRRNCAREGKSLPPQGRGQPSFCHAATPQR